MHLAMALMAGMIVALLFCAGAKAETNTCGQPPAVDKANVVVNTTTSPSIPFVRAIYTCDASRGYSATGGSVTGGVGTIICVKTGSHSLWSAANFTCARLQCQGNPPVESATTSMDYTKKIVTSRGCSYFDRIYGRYGCRYYRYVTYTTTYKSAEVYYGEYVNATCRDGYRYTDNTTVAKIECGANGQWKYPNKTCQPIDCGTFDKFEGMNCDEGPSYYPSEVRCRCNFGYERNISSGIYLKDRYGYYIRDSYGQHVFINKTANNYMVQCSASGSWHRPDVDPTGRSCSRVICPVLPIIPNSDQNKTIVRGLRWKDTVTYFCLNGHDTVGDATITCQANKAWTTLPQCIAKDCGPPPNVTNGHVKSGRVTGTIVADTVQYECNIGYRVVSVNYTRCGEDGIWSTLPVCHRVRCGDPPALKNSWRTVQGHYYGDATIYQCNAGLTLHGNSTIYCQFDSHWTAPPKCYAHRRNPAYTDAESTKQPATTAETPETDVGSKAAKTAEQLERSDYQQHPEGNNNLTAEIAFLKKITEQLERSDDQQHPERSYDLTAGIAVLTSLVLVLLLAISIWYNVKHRRQMDDDINTTLSISNPLYRSERDTTDLYPTKKI